eukprot:UN30955
MNIQKLGKKSLDFVYNVLKVVRPFLPLGMYLTFGNHDKFAEENMEFVQKICKAVGATIVVNQAFSINKPGFAPIRVFMSPMSCYRGRPSNAFQVNLLDSKDKDQT